MIAQSSVTHPSVQERLPLAQISRERAVGRRDHHHALSRYNDLATRDQNAGPSYAIPDANISVARILPNNIGHVINGHVEGIRQTRTVVHQRHVKVPRRETSGNYYISMFGVPLDLSQPKTKSILRRNDWHKLHSEAA